jgi:hypothetical protein
MPTDLTLPTVHLNGTGRKTLAEGYFEAWNRLNEAIAAFNAIEFNARDYYVQPEGAWPKARTERDCAAAHLHQAHAYLETHLLHLGE